MATDTYRSNLRKDQNRGVSGTRDRRRVFEDGGSSGGVSSYTSSTTTTSRFSRDRTDTPSSRGTSTITSKFNKLNVNDDGEEEAKKEETTRRGGGLKKATGTTVSPGSTGTSSLANKINKLNVNDGEDDPEDESDEKEEGEEEPTRKKQIKKSGATSANSGQKRKQRKNLRQKRRSTGVVIMPGQPVSANDDDERITQENTAKNMDEGTDGGGGSQPTDAQMEIAKQNDKYIEDLKEELAKAHRELESVHNCNMRLKDENRALLRVVGSLTSSK